MESARKGKVLTYIKQLVAHQSSLEDTIQELVVALQSHRGSIFLTGVGKSGHIGRKCVATWQSLGLRCHFLHPQDSFHGDMGVVHPGDAVVYLSNSGKTEELIRLASHLQGRGILQIRIANATTSPLDEYVTHAIILCKGHKILEADNDSLVPSVSSALFMIVLDSAGMCLAEGQGYSRADFKKNHPSGTLGSAL